MTLTLLVYGFAVCIAKLALSGTDVCGVRFGDFSGADFALAVGAVGAIYWGRRHTEKGTAPQDGPPAEGPPQ